MRRVMSAFAFWIAVITQLPTISPKVFAISPSSFQAGHIIDDSIFFNSNTMDTNTIQAFLNSKVPVCETNHPRTSSINDPGPPYTCLKDYQQSIPTMTADSYCNGGFTGGNYSAAQIIYTVSRACNINPQVLIVLLQKEQGLVVDTWPWPIQYRSATGYGCPDTAACDSTYYGFFNQVYNAAHQFQRYVKQSNLFNYRAGSTSYIQYNPTASCGGSNVFIQNQATAALYNYTPYQPTQAALNAGYGSTPPCGAYGNRNFWLYFNDWFGPTIGPLVRSQSSPELYYSDGTNKYRVGSMNMVQEYGLGINDVRIVQQSEMDSLTLASSPNTPDLSLVVKSNSDSDEDGGNIYLISSGRRYLITSMNMLSDFGFTTNSIGYMPLSQLVRMPVVGNLNNFIRNKDNGYVYKVQAGQMRGILDLQTFMQLNPSGSVSELGSYVLQSLPLGQALVSGNAVLRAEDGQLWLVSSDGWHYIPSLSAYNCLGLDGIKNLTFNRYQSIIGTRLADVECVVENSSGQRYITDGVRRLPVDSTWGFSTFFHADDALIASLPTYNPTTHPVFRTQNDGSLYVLEGGKRRQIINMVSFTDNGYLNNDIYTSTTDFLGTIPRGSYKLSTNMLVRDTSSGALSIITGASTKYGIPSMTIFNSYGYNPNAIINLDPTNLAAYTNVGTIQQQLAYAPSATVFDSGIALQIPANLESHFGFSPSRPTYSSAVASYGSIRTATRYLKFGSSPMLYYMENGTKRPVYSWDTFTSLGGSTSNITGLSESAAALFPTGSPM